MKRKCLLYVVMLTTTLLLSACSVSDIKDKIPFLHKEEEEVVEVPPTTEEILGYTAQDLLSSGDTEAYCMRTYCKSELMLNVRMNGYTNPTKVEDVIIFTSVGDQEHIEQLTTTTVDDKSSSAYNERYVIPEKQGVFTQSNFEGWQSHTDSTIKATKYLLSIPTAVNTELSIIDDNNVSVSGSFTPDNSFPIGAVITKLTSRYNLSNCDCKFSATYDRFTKTITGLTVEVTSDATGSYNDNECTLESGSISFTPVERSTDGVMTVEQYIYDTAVSQDVVEQTPEEQPAEVTEEVTEQPAEGEAEAEVETEVNTEAEQPITEETQEETPVEEVQEDTKEEEAKTNVPL